MPSNGRYSHTNSRTSAALRTKPNLLILLNAIGVITSLGIIAEDYCLSIIETVTAACRNIARKFALVTVFAKSSLVNGAAAFW